MAQQSEPRNHTNALFPPQTSQHLHGRALFILAAAQGPRLSVVALLLSSKAGECAPAVAATAYLLWQAISAMDHCFLNLYARLSERCGAMAVLGRRSGNLHAGSNHAGAGRGAVERMKDTQAYGNV
jgi:hypothetical protein